MASVCCTGKATWRLKPSMTATNDMTESKLESEYRAGSRDCLRGCGSPSRWTLKGPTPMQRASSMGAATQAANKQSREDHCDQPAAVMPESGLPRKAAAASNTASRGSQSRPAKTHQKASKAN